MGYYPLPPPYPPSISDILTGKMGGLIPSLKYGPLYPQKKFWKNFWKIWTFMYLCGIIKINIYEYT
jgi:hypothetical protein